MQMRQRVVNHRVFVKLLVGKTMVLRSNQTFYIVLSGPYARPYKIARFARRTSIHLLIKPFIGKVVGMLKRTFKISHLHAPSPELSAGGRQRTSLSSLKLSVHNLPGSHRLLCRDSAETLHTYSSTTSCNLWLLLGLEMC